VINLVEGMAYVNWLGKDEFALTFSNEKISIDHAAHFRLDASTEAASLAVFKGEVAVDGSAGKFMIEKKTTATFNAVDDDKYTLAGNITEAPLDSWDRDASAYHDQYARNNSSNNLSPYRIRGERHELLWRVFECARLWDDVAALLYAGAGWDPFMDGAWSWYPGYGYMFASAYPWGWMPYHYGSWMMIPGNGWMWQPGGFNTWLAAPHVLRDAAGKFPSAGRACGGDGKDDCGREGWSDLGRARVVPDGQVRLGGHGDCAGLAGES
jgi:hypothetical protein